MSIMYNIPNHVRNTFFNANYVVAHLIFVHMYHFTKSHYITYNMYPQTLYEHLKNIS